MFLILIELKNINSKIFLQGLGWNSKYNQNMSPGPMPPPVNPGVYGGNVNIPRAPKPNVPNIGSGGPRNMRTPSMGNVLSGRGNTGPGRFNSPFNKKSY